MSTRVLTSSTWTGNTGVALLNASVTIEDASSGARTIRLPTIQINYSCFKEEVYDLVSGYNEITIPVNATNTKAMYVMIVPPEGNTTALTLKGITGDTGHKLHPGAWNLISITSTATVPTVIGLTAGAAIAGVRLLWM